LKSKAGAGRAGSAEAGWRELAGCKLPEAESLSLRRVLTYPTKGGIRTGALC
jgi:hypothetical protein